MKKRVAKRMVKASVDYDTYINELLQDPREAKSYAEAIFKAYEEDYNVKALLIGLHRLARAQGGLGELAEKTLLNRQNLYKVFSGKSVPRIDTLSTILHGLGLRLSVEQIKENSNVR